ncbi:FAD-dependent pyridine nucleotide-disulphide oxidoreductase [Candidatus Zixiibacteriota bacterium]|nr:FAD-dependent pyridine nucleotide-disulphide oxidoreductase [candidate division Zixibacteria bacterium]
MANIIGSDFRVVIIGGGFGGLYAALSMRRLSAQITLIDRRNFHLFQPLLYQVATGALSPADIASPLRAVLKRQKNTRVVMGEVVDIDVAGRKVILSDGQIPYDVLIVATGSRHHYFGHDNWENVAPGLKTIEDATEIRRRILLAFEAAERERDPEIIKELLTFVVVGGGPTGVELAGALGEIAHRALKEDFRHINPEQARIFLVEGYDRILIAYPPALSEKAQKALEKKFGVTVMTRSQVTGVAPERVQIKADGKESFISARTILWAAGVRSSRLGKIISDKTGAVLDRTGRVKVEPDLSVKGHPEILIIGDLANIDNGRGEPLPALAPVAMQEGRYMAALLKKRLRGKKCRPFRFRNHGTMATIGRNAAVADLGWIRFGGYLGWLAWLFIHLMYIVEYENRLLVLVQWAWNYVTGNRTARLVTGMNPFPLKKPKIENGAVMMEEEGNAKD